MRSRPNAIPAVPPPEVLAELDAAVAALDALAARAAEIRLVLDEQACSLRLELREGGTARALSPAELLDLLRAP